MRVEEVVGREIVQFASFLNVYYTNKVFQTIKHWHVHLIEFNHRLGIYLGRYIFDNSREIDGLNSHIV